MVYNVYNEFPLHFKVYIDIHEYTNYANKIISIFDYEIKALCLIFNLIRI